MWNSYKAVVTILIKNHLLCDLAKNASIVFTAERYETAEKEFLSMTLK